jgi:hypothetical protein
MAKQVFISYASADRLAAERVRDDLEADGIDCWIAPRDVPAGSDYARAITDSIGSCKVLLLLFSHAAARSNHIEREVHLADNAKLPIVPVRIEPVEPGGSLRYFLSTVQWIDAFPRLEPQLGLLRSEIRRLLATRGTTVVSPRASRFARTLATAGGWTLIVVFEVLMLEWMHRIWVDLAPLWTVPVEAFRSPGLAALLVAPPVVAMALQFFAHRSLHHVASLDALFAMSASGWPRIRLVAAGALCAGMAIACALAPPTVAVRLEPGKLDPRDNYVQVRSCSRSPSYTTQTETHYRIDLRVGSYNPPGAYALRAELAPYATQDGVEFCEIWVDRGLGVTTVRLLSDDDRSSGYVEIGGPLERFAGRRSLLFNVRHYRDSTPSAGATVTASLARGPVARNDHEPIAVPLR